jgi:Arylsulfotransferase (ASST)
MIAGYGWRMPCVNGVGWTRRRFLSAAGTALVAVATPAVPRAAAARRLVEGLQRLDGVGATVRTFASRPDLSPPAVTIVTGPQAPAGDHALVAPFLGDGQYGPLIVDLAGEPVWFQPITGVTAINLRLQKYRRARVLTWWEGKVLGGGYGGGTGVILDAQYRELARVKAQKGYQSDLHDFVITSRQTALIAIYNELTADLTAFGGPADGRVIEGVVQEIDIASKRLLFEWHSLDHVPLDETLRTYPTDPGQFDYFHLNSIGVDPDGNLLVGARHTSTVYKIDRRTGAVIWRLGGKRNDFRIGTGASFNFQHDARRHADGTLTLFDNGAFGPTGVVEPASRALQLAVDESAKTATLVRQYVTPDPRLAIAMGNVQLLPDGSAFVGWGTKGSFSQIGTDGALRFDARFPGGGISYRAYQETWVGRPTTTPTVVTSRDSTGATTAYVSWNGATNVARWQLSSGTRSDRLRAMGSVPRTGFETAIPVPAAGGYISVTALDPAGQALAGSTPLKL